MNTISMQELTTVEMQDLAAEAAEAGNRQDADYWSARSHGDSHTEAWAFAHRP